jgi:hypothetical protein
MSAAYYDIQAEQGATFRLYLTVANESGQALNLLGSNGFVPIEELPKGFEQRFIDTEGNSIAKVFVRMQVRNSVDGIIIPINPPSDLTTVDEIPLMGVSGYGENYFPIDIQLGDGGTDKSEPNVIITIDAVHMEGVPYGKPLYDIELVYAQDIINHPKKVVYRVMQGRFIVTPNITK